MAADLTISKLVYSESLLITEDSLVCLERRSTKDRVRRILFDRLESVVVWRTLPLVAMLIVALLLGPIGLILMVVGDEGRIAGDILIAILFLVEIGLLLCGKTHIRIAHEGKRREFSLVARPGKAHRFVRRLCESIEASQARAIRRAEEHQAEEGP